MCLLLDRHRFGRDPMVNVVGCKFTNEICWGRRGRDCMVVGFTTTCTISADHH